MTYADGGRSHDTVRELLAADALDALSGDDRETMRAHLATCTECATLLQGYRETAALLALAVPPSPMQPGRAERLRARLVARAAASVSDADRDDTARSAGTLAAHESGPDADIVPLPLAEREGGLWRNTGWLAAAAVLVIMAGAYLSQRRELTSARSTLAAARVARDSLAQRVATRDSLLAALTGPQVAILQLTAAGERAPSARMFWDRATDRWTLVSHDLPALPPGRTYQMWIIAADRQAPVSGGVFAPDANGDAIHGATFALPASALRAVAVTEEPAGGSPAPTSTPFLVANAGS